MFAFRRPHLVATTLVLACAFARLRWPTGLVRRKRADRRGHSRGGRNRHLRHRRTPHRRRFDCLSHAGRREAGPGRTAAAALESAATLAQRHLGGNARPVGGTKGVDRTGAAGRPAHRCAARPAAGKPAPAGALRAATGQRRLRCRTPTSWPRCRARVLALVEMDISGKALAKLQRLDRLRSLDLRKCEALKADDYRLLPALKSLRELKISGPSAGYRAMETVAAMPALESLVLEDSPVSAAGGPRGWREATDLPAECGRWHSADATGSPMMRCARRGDAAAGSRFRFASAP